MLQVFVTYSKEAEKLFNIYDVQLGFNMSKLKGITLICGYLDVQNKPICHLKANCNTIFDRLKGLVSDSTFRAKFYFLKCKWMFQESFAKIEIYIETKKRMK